MIVSMLIESPFWLAAGWTMLHFLWVGAAIGLLAASGRVVLRSAGPNARYCFVLFCLAALAVAPGVIAAHVLGTPVADPRPAVDPIGLEPSAATTIVLDPEVGVAADTVVALPEPLAPEVDAPAGLPAAWVRCLAVLSELAAWLPWLWLIGTPVVFATVATGLTGAELLRLQSRVLDDDTWTALRDRLARALGVSRYVVVGVCDRVASPIVIGIARPMIVLPSAALSGWTPEQIEMVLLHELAHVRRWDNLVNLLQRIVESVLFFHPVVWFVSGWVRREREHCCDALVLAHTKAPRAYAETLAAFVLPGPALRAAAVGMGESSIVARIRRILNLEERSMRLSRRVLSIAVVAVAGSALFVAAYARQTQRLESDRMDAATVDSKSEARVDDTKPANASRVSGVVRTPDGTPAAGAQVVLGEGKRPLDLYLRNGSAREGRGVVVVRAGRDGRFTLPPQRGRFMLVVLHDSGIAEVRSEALAASPAITLRPWGRVEGTLRIGREPGRRQTIYLNVPWDPHEVEEGVAYRLLQTETDDAGRFVIAHAPSGEGRVARRVEIGSGTYTESHHRIINIVSGKTTSVEIGGTGRPVTGRLVLPPDLGLTFKDLETRAYISTDRASRPRPAGDEALDDDERRRRAKARRHQASANFPVVVGDDGTLRVDDVPAGRYLLTVVDAYPRGDRPTNWQGGAAKMFEIPEIPGGRSDEPFDLGTIKLELRKREAPLPAAASSAEAGVSAPQRHSSAATPPPWRQNAVLAIKGISATQAKQRILRHFSHGTDGARDGETANAPGDRLTIVPVAETNRLLLSASAADVEAILSLLADFIDTRSREDAEPTPRALDASASSPPGRRASRRVGTPAIADASVPRTGRRMAIFTLKGISPEEAKQLILRAASRGTDGERGGAEPRMLGDRIRVETIAGSNQIVLSGSAADVEAIEALLAGFVVNRSREDADASTPALGSSSSSRFRRRAPGRGTTAVRPPGRRGAVPRGAVGGRSATQPARLPTSRPGPRPVIEIIQLPAEVPAEEVAPFVEQLMNKLNPPRAMPEDFVQVIAEPRANLLIVGALPERTNAMRPVIDAIINAQSALAVKWETAVLDVGHVDAEVAKQRFEEADAAASRGRIKMEAIGDKLVVRAPANQMPGIRQLLDQVVEAPVAVAAPQRANRSGRRRVERAGNRRRIAPAEPPGTAGTVRGVIPNGSSRVVSTRPAARARGAGAVARPEVKAIALPRDVLAEDVASTLAEIFSSIVPPGYQPVEAVSIVAEPRSNSLLVAANPDRFDQVQRAVDTIVNAPPVPAATMGSAIPPIVRVPANGRRSVRAQADGLIATVKVKMGQPVKKGQLLVQLDSADMEIEFAAAEVRLDSARAKFERAAELAKQKAIAQHERRELEAEVRLADLDVRRWRLRLERTRITSPVDGVVTMVTGPAGKKVTAGEQVAIIAPSVPATQPSRRDPDPRNTPRSGASFSPAVKELAAAASNDKADVPRFANTRTGRVEWIEEGRIDATGVSTWTAPSIGVLTLQRLEGSRLGVFLGRPSAGILGALLESDKPTDRHLRAVFVDRRGARHLGQELGMASNGWTNVRLNGFRSPDDCLADQIETVVLERARRTLRSTFGKE